MRNQRLDRGTSPKKSPRKVSKRRDTSNSRVEGCEDPKNNRQNTLEELEKDTGDLYRTVLLESFPRVSGDLHIRNQLGFPL